MGTGSSRRREAAGGGAGGASSGQSAGASALQRSAPKAPTCDVAISYHGDDIALMRYIQGEFESQKLTVFADVAEDTDKEEGKSGSAIVQAKVFVLILSPSSAECKSCNREVQLAYISDKPIFPVTVRDHEDPELQKAMDFGLKLTLQPMDWIFFTNVDDKATPMKELTAGVRQQIKSIEEEEAGTAGANQPASNTGSSDAKVVAVESVTVEQRRSRVTMNRTAKLVTDKSLVRAESEIGDATASADHVPGTARTFWDRHFEGHDTVQWEQFKNAFLEEYGAKLESLVSSDQDTIKWILKLTQREVFDGKDTTSKTSFLDFRGRRPERDLFFKRISQLALESYSMHGVFSMDSTVRLAAVENLGKFSSAAVIEALLDLLDDPDANIRAVAAISLGRTGAGQAKSIPRLIAGLADSDRLVREACCLSLGHLKSAEAVPHIVNRWRNDFISHVREAAHVALKNIGGEEAGRAIHMTEVLTKEIRDLTS
ncbi:uncharacterized protein LOC135824809 [Sycon ciliatum]|uniref:uncharacterized protein LOC135824809 n=1 Tax=Sycon ciliatum TaxID=27933 RepID=UPI0031F714C4